MNYAVLLYCSPMQNFFTEDILVLIPLLWVSNALSNNPRKAEPSCMLTKHTTNSVLSCRVFEFIN